LRAAQESVPDACQRDIRFYGFATRRITKILTVGREISDVEVSPDGRAIVCVQNDQFGSDLMLVENFR
jgi:hypothetical protein